MTGPAGRIAWAATLACHLEASAQKPGNVTPTRSFGDMTYVDFLLSGLAIGPVLGRASRHGVGELVRRSILATQAVTSANTNLGILLLCAPMARAYALYRPTDLAGLREALQLILASLTVADARSAYAAIRLAQPGGLGKSEAHDVAAEPTVTLGQAMAVAADRDLVAAQYSTGYALIFEVGVPAFRAARAEGAGALDGVVQVFLALLATAPDTLIARKLGRAAAEEVSRLTRTALELGGLATAAGRQALAKLDRDLRDAQNRRNPGATADLTAAVLFALLLIEGAAGLQPG